METTTTEIAGDVYRISTFVADAGMSFNQSLVNADEPLLFTPACERCSHPSPMPSARCSHSPRGVGSAPGTSKPTSVAP